MSGIVSDRLEKRQANYSATATPEAITYDMRKIILLAAGIVLVGGLILVSLQPDTMMIERSATISAPAATVFEHVNDLHLWNTWSPWATLDPDMQLTYGNTATGIGATCAWKGNNEVGEGNMTITESVPPTRVGMHLVFVKPFASTSEVVFMVNAADAGHTLISWTMQSKANFVIKAMGLFINMDAAIGRDFERGLATLKAKLTGPPDVPRTSAPAGSPTPAAMP